MDRARGDQGKAACEHAPEHDQAAEKGEVHAEIDDEGADPPLAPDRREEGQRDDPDAEADHGRLDQK